MKSGSGDVRSVPARKATGAAAALNTSAPTSLKSENPGTGTVSDSVDALLSSPAGFEVISRLWESASYADRYAPSVGAISGLYTIQNCPAGNGGMGRIPKGNTSTVPKAGPGPSPRLIGGGTFST